MSEQRQGAGSKVWRRNDAQATSTSTPSFPATTSVPPPAGTQRPCKHAATAPGQPAATQLRAHANGPVTSWTAAGGSGLHRPHGAPHGSHAAGTRPAPSLGAAGRAPTRPTTPRGAAPDTLPPPAKRPRIETPKGSLKTELLPMGDAMCVSKVQTRLSQAFTLTGRVHDCMWMLLNGRNSAAHQLMGPYICPPLPSLFPLPPLLNVLQA